MSAIRKRFDYATELRAYADKVERLELANRHDPEAPIVAKVALAQEMRARAKEVMRREDPTERGRINPDTVFASGKVVSIEVKRARVIELARTRAAPDRASRSTLRLAA